MDLPDDLRPGQTEDVVIIFERRRVIPKEVTPIILLLQIEALDHRPHRAVEDQNPFSEEINDIEGIRMAKIVRHILENL